MSSDPPLLSLPRLRRVLGLDRDASTAELESAASKLLDHLLHRRETLSGEERSALDREIEILAGSVESWTQPPHSRPKRTRTGSTWRRRARRGAILAMVGLGAVAVAYWMGFRLIRLPPSEPGADGGGTEMARLILESRPRGAELRVRPPDQEELLLKIPADGVRLELEPGLYDLEVSREDCPDAWHQTLELRAGETRHFEPEICRGEAELVVRSNVTGDRLRIDGFDFGATGAEPHLLSVGDHTIQVDKEGYAPFEGKVRLEPGKPLELRADLVALDSSQGRKGRPLPFQHVPPSVPPNAKDAQTESPKPAMPLDLDVGFEAPPLGVPTRLLDLDDARGNRPRGGSTTWHDAVSRQLISRFDRDGSGRIDRVEESEAISCELWRELERDFDEGGLGLSMARNYGFDGSEWIDGALGFSRSIRSAVYAKMLECGLAP